MAINSHKMPNLIEEKNLFWKDANFLIEILMTKSVTLLNEFIIMVFIYEQSILDSFYLC